jgi:hypothetical protein
MQHKLTWRFGQAKVAELDMFIGSATLEVTTIRQLSAEASSSKPAELCQTSLLLHPRILMQSFRSAVHAGIEDTEQFPIKAGLL